VDAALYCLVGGLLVGELLAETDQGGVYLVEGFYHKKFRKIERGGRRLLGKLFEIICD